MRKIDYAIGAARLFIHHLHQDGIDRGMIATFGNTFRVEQRFTSTEVYLHNALATLPSTVVNAVNKNQGESTRLYDSMEDVINHFWDERLGAARNRPWLLTIITDGQDNLSTRYPHKDSLSPARIGQCIAQRFNHEPSNYPFLIGVGEGQYIDKQALATIGAYGRFPAVTIEAFPLLELMFLEIAINVSEQVSGVTIRQGSRSWQEVSRIRQTTRIPIDYAFLIDLSGSMSETGG